MQARINRIVIMSSDVFKKINGFIEEAKTKQAT